MRNLICTLSFAALSLLGTVPASAEPASGLAPASQASPASIKRGNANSAALASPGTPQTASSPAAAVVINIGEATAEQLEQLPGVGPSKAGAIVAHRKQHPFKKLEDLMRVKGIGKKTFARLKPMLTLSGPTTLPEQKTVARR